MLHFVRFIVVELDANFYTQTLIIVCSQSYPWFVMSAIQPLHEGPLLLQHLKHKCAKACPWSVPAPTSAKPWHSTVHLGNPFCLQKTKLATSSPWCQGVAKACPARPWPRPSSTCPRRPRRTRCPGTPCSSAPKGSCTGLDLTCQRL